MSGDTMTYQIPDATKIIITYRARVAFPPNSQTGENKLTFKNDVKMLGYEKEGDMAEAFRYGVAAGAASVLTEGTQLIIPEDFYNLLAQVRVQEV